MIQREQNQLCRRVLSGPARPSLCARQTRLITPHGERPRPRTEDPVVWVLWFSQSSLQLRPMATSSSPGSGGRLAHLLATRGSDVATESAIVLQHREALVYTLGKAAALEHLVMCQYLYAAFSMKDREDDGLTPAALGAVRRWEREMLQIAEQEMLHLALVQNLLTAIGAAPYFGRPNFPLSPRAYPAGIKMALLSFGETALRNFAHLELSLIHI